MEQTLKPAKVTVVVATYNRANYLRLTLKSLQEQDYAGKYEVVVGDDGSSDETDQVVADAVQNRAAPEIHYVKQEDKGYRRAELLNESVRRGATGDLLAFIDSDCLPDHDFVRTYAEHVQNKAFYLGGVYALHQQFTESLLTRQGTITAADMIKQARQAENQSKGAAKRVARRYRKSRLYAALHWRRPKIWGGNFAVNRDVFEAINGFDENYVGYGQEDSDIRNRLILGRYRPICLHTKARTFHLWHPATKAHIATGQGGRKERHNRGYYNRSEMTVVCQNGLKK